MKTQHATLKSAPEIGPLPNTWTTCLQGEQAGVSILILAQTSDEPFNGIKSLKLTKGSLLCHCFEDTVLWESSKMKTDTVCLTSLLSLNRYRTEN